MKTNTARKIKGILKCSLVCLPLLTGALSLVSFAVTDISDTVVAKKIVKESKNNQEVIQYISDKTDEFKELLNKEEITIEEYYDKLSNVTELDGGVAEAIDNIDSENVSELKGKLKTERNLSLASDISLYSLFGSIGLMALLFIGGTDHSLASKLIDKAEDDFIPVDTSLKREVDNLPDVTRTIE